MSKKFITVALMVFVLVGISVSLVMAEETKLSGKDYVNLGQIQIIEGELKAEGEEWLLQTNTLLYEVHLGYHEHQEKIGLDIKEGDKVTIIGFVYEDNIAVVSLSYTEFTYSFRYINGVPKWSGQGNRSNAALDHDHDHDSCDDEEGESNFDDFENDGSFNTGE